MLGRMIKVFSFSNLQRKVRILKEFFMLGRLMIFFFQFHKEDSVYSRSFLLGRKTKIFFFPSKSEKYLENFPVFVKL